MIAGVKTFTMHVKNLQIMRLSWRKKVEDEAFNSWHFICEYFNSMTKLSRIIFRLFLLIIYIEKRLYLTSQVKKHLRGIKHYFPQTRKRVILWDENTEEETEIGKKKKKRKTF
jgi:hypothetical protein